MDRNEPGLDDGRQRKEPTSAQVAVTEDVFRDVIGRFVSGVTIITSVADGHRYGTTASAVSSLSLDPPMLLVCMNKRSNTRSAIAATGRFAVSILAEDQADAAIRFASKDADKFKDLATTTSRAGMPLIPSALATLECRTVKEVEGGTHSVFLASVEHATSRAGAPLAYFRGRFGRVETATEGSVFQELKNRILNRDFPVDEPLDVDPLAANLQATPEVVRHALSRLAGEYLLTRNADESFVVRALTYEVVADALRGRCVIEVGVITRTLGRITPAQLMRTRRLAEALDPREADGTSVSRAEWADRLSEFTQHCVKLAGSAALLDAYRRLNVPTMITNLRGGDHVPADLPDDIASEHLDLVAAYERNDLAGAIQAIERRTERALDLLRLYTEAAGGAI